MSGPSGPEFRTKIVYRTPSSAGLMSGLFGSVFAILGIFTLGLVFLPFAVLFSFVSIIRSISGFSASGFCAAIASSILTFIGFVVSPTTWLVLIGLLGLAMTNSAGPPASNPPSQPNASTLMQSPVGGPPINAPPASPPQTSPSAPDDSGGDISLPDSSLPGMTPPPPDSTSPPAAPQLSTLQGFAAGAADRAVMEAWFNSLSGSFKEGAEFWAANRSLRPHPPDFYQGCLAAKAQLDHVDVRRLGDPEYRAGWNTPPS